MAKGNNGNYLQHSIEVALAWHLVTRTAGNHLHISLTHGMAPYESCGCLPNGQTKTLLDNALSRAKEPRADGETPIVSAYRATKAKRCRYPNTGELLAAVIGRDHLHGGITETCSYKHTKLASAWKATGVKAVRASWRAEILPRGILSCPESLSCPWLFSADPMTYSEKPCKDDDKLYRDDLGLLEGVLKPFIESGQPGAASLFVYAVRKDNRPKFWSFAKELAERIGTVLISAWVPHQGGNRNLAAILLSPAMFRPTWFAEGVQCGP